MYEWIKSNITQAIIRLITFILISFVVANFNLNTSAINETLSLSYLRLASNDSGALKTEKWKEL